MEQMGTRWVERKDSWLRQTILEEDLSRWAIDAIERNQKGINELEELLDQKIINEEKIKEIEYLLMRFRNTLKIEISKKDKSLDEISLNPSNSLKLQVSIPSSLNYLMKAWAAAEGRDLSSVALQCLEAGLRSMKSKGSIPTAAVKRYDLACEKRIALSEVCDVWDKHEEQSINK